MATEILATLMAALGTAVGSFITWLFNRKAQAAETKGKEEESTSKEIDNEIKLSNYYKEMLDDLNARYEKKYQELVAMYDKKVQMLEDEIKLLRRKNAALIQENKELKKQLNEQSKGSR